MLGWQTGFFQLQVKQNQIITKYSVLTIIFIGKVCIIYNVKSTFSVQAVVTWSCARAPSRVSNALSCLSARTMPICPFHSVHRIDDESNKLPILSFHIRSDIISCVRAGKSRHCSRCRFWSVKNFLDELAVCAIDLYAVDT